MKSMKTWVHRHISDKGLVSRIYKELQLNNKNINHLIKKVDKDLNRNFTNKRLWMAKKHMKSTEHHQLLGNASEYLYEISLYTHQNG